jgi:hypothetical protein
MGTRSTRFKTSALRALFCGSVVGALAWLSFELTPHPPIASAQTPASAPIGANGRNAQVVEFGFAGAKQGEFRLTGTRAWGEFGQDDVARFRFEEQNRDEWSVYLYDRTRNIYIQLDMYTRKVLYGPAYGSLNEIYKVLAAWPSPRPKGLTTTSVAYGDVKQQQKLGEYSQTGPGQWTQYDRGHQRLARFKETLRDDNGVYLSDCRDGTKIQLDLHRREVVPSGVGILGFEALPVSVEAEYAVSAPPAVTTDCGYVIASVEPDGGLRYLRAPEDTGAIRARALVSRDFVRDPCTGKLSTDSFWSLMPSYTLKVVPPGGTTPVDAFAMSIVSLRTGNTLEFDPDGYLKVVSPFFSKGAPAPQLLFVPTGSVTGNTPLTFEIRELKDGAMGRKVLTFDDRLKEPASLMTVVNKPTAELLTGTDASHYRRSLAVFSPNCPAVAGITSRNPNVDAQRTMLLMSQWGIQGDMSPITPLAATAYSGWPPPFLDLFRVEGNATTPNVCPDGTVAVGLGIFGHSAERRTLICRRYPGKTRPSSTYPTKFPIADQGDGQVGGVPRKGEQLTPGALTGLACGDNRQCSMSYIEGLATNQCRWMEGPRINYMDSRSRDFDFTYRDYLADKSFRPGNEVWCDGDGEVLTGLNCASALQGKFTEEHFCDHLGLRCCKAASSYAGNVDSPHGDQSQTTVWSPMYGYNAKLDKNAPDLAFSCPNGFVASGFDCGDNPKSCKNKSLGCKRLDVTDDGKRSQVPRTNDSTGTGTYERGLAVTGMRCKSPSCKEIALQHVKLKPDGTNHETCRWATLTNEGYSSPSQCTASEYLADIRCKNGNDCSDLVEMKCCIDAGGRLGSKRISEMSDGPLISPPRFQTPPPPLNEKQAACRAECDGNEVAQSLFSCSIGVFSRQDCSPAATVVVACHIGCMIANP